MTFTLKTGLRELNEKVKISRQKLKREHESERVEIAEM